MPRTSIKKADKPLPRMKMGEIGSTGLRLSAGRINEEMRRELRFPHCVNIYKTMAYDPTISAALTLYDLMFSGSVWHVRAPEKATAEQKEKVEFIKQCMNDMKHSWREFIQETGSMITYGFAVHEKVFRRRLKENGSKYNDGKIGWAKLATRSQDTIEKWYWSDDGRELTGLCQNLNLSSHEGRFNIARDGSQVDIPRKKFLLFRTGKRRENPEGESALKGVYHAWKYRLAIEETEAIGIQRDLNGLPIIYIPPQYMSDDATPEQKAVYDYYKNMVTMIQNNQQSGIIMPMAYDPETKQPLFKFELMSSDGKKNFDTDKIITRYDNKILTTLGADILILGQGSTGSYNLASIKQTLVNLNMDAKLQEIADVINNDLIPHTFALNGWDDEVFPEIYFDPLGNESLEEVSKFVQRVASTGMIERDRSVLNFIRETLGVDPLPEDAPIDEKALPNMESRASDGMAKGSGNGTSDKAAGTDGSSKNLDNAA